MDIEEIEKRIKEEKNRNHRVLNNLSDKRCAENRHHQRQMEYLQNQKEQAKAQKKSIEESLNESYKKQEALFEKIQQLIKKATEEYK